MKLTKTPSEVHDGCDIVISEGDKNLTILFGGTGDLYWMLRSSDPYDDSDHLSFSISNENYALYEAFKNLFIRIENIDLYEDRTFPRYINTKEEIELYLKKERESFERTNKGHYHELFDKLNKTITWYSDETSHKVSNYVVIRMNKTSFDIDFYSQPHIWGYEREFNRKGVLSIRFRNSGSRYEPFNAVFMRMFHELQNIDDVNDEGHQIHIEEFLRK